MVEDNGLKRCPFCGGKVDEWDVDSKKPIKMFKIQCCSCKAQMGLFADCEKGENEARDMWNNRVSDLPSVDYRVANYYWQILHDINPKLADDASEMARKQVEEGHGLADVKDIPTITDYDLPINTIATYERMLKEREAEIVNYKSSVTRFKHLYEKEKNLIGKRKVAITTTDFTKIKNIKKYADVLYDTFDELFKEEYGEDYAEKITRKDNL